MWLGIDAGNSNVVLGIFEGSVGESPRPVRRYRLSTHPLGTPDELRARIHALLALEEGARAQEWLSPRTPVILASVVPGFTRLAREAFAPAQLRVIDSTWPFTIRIATREPGRTGIDRLVNAEAVFREQPAPAIIVDSGTATTICALGPDGIFLGGAILPGIEAAREGLVARASQLPRVELQAPARAIGPDTESALQSGLVLGYASMIDGMIARFKHELAEHAGAATSSSSAPRPRVIATGGAAALLGRVCTGIDTVDEDLTLRGIAYLAATHTR